MCIRDRACADKIKQHWQQHEPAEKLLLSYHGVPRRYLESGDPYYCQCQKTSRLICEKLGLDETQCITTFQSRFGKAEWLKPYTDEPLIELAKNGTKKISIISPGFVTDCLETLDEIKNEASWIIHGVKGDDSWRIENFQRNYIKKVCSKFAKEDIMILSDVDEIPSKEKLSFIMNCIPTQTIPQKF